MRDAGHSHGLRGDGLDELRHVILREPAGQELLNFGLGSVSRCGNQIVGIVRSEAGLQQHDRAEMQPARGQSVPVTLT